MALSAYQKQYKRRATKALALYTKARKQVRALVGQLVAAEQGNAAAAARTNRLNALYGTALPAATDLVADFGTSETLANLAGNQEADALLYADVADGNGGAALPTEAAFGE
ncbi:hypothetical protein [Hymenobacter coccineus]|uniref:Uncharacterized protein n=1 Tax=Hymenobacter coccineus TaxID=1908235 RepID=A0A1G1THZ2_9BACT|nr:hypothetical protein [Hymenobacter coccineus]OGX90485.1 hypothetical protein BEN49_22690 [Hymenobacter coccineus]